MNDDEDREVRKRLDEAVGTRFDPEARAGFLGRFRHGALKAIVAGLLAVGAALLVVYTIESHRLPSAEKVDAVRSGKSVEVFVLPSETTSK